MSAKKNNAIVEILGKVVIPLVVAIISAGTTYLIATRDDAPASPPKTDTLLEEFPVHIFAFAGNNDPEGGWGAFDVYFENDMKPVYAFKYSLPTDGANGYAGMTFKFEQGTDLSEYQSISFLLRIPTSEEVDLVVKDISGQELRYRLKGGPQPETKIDIALSNFKDVNLKAVREFMFFADTGFVVGDHSLAVKEFKFLR